MNSINHIQSGTSTFASDQIMFFKRTDNCCYLYGKTQILYSIFSDWATLNNFCYLTGIHSLGSPQWGEDGGGHVHSLTHDPSLTQFLVGLRALLRQAFAVCVITMPTHLFHVRINMINAFFS